MAKACQFSNKNHPLATLKEKTISGLIWSFTDKFSRQGIAFVVGIILARLLTPREFGLIGMITIFIAIAQPIVDSGFNQALIRKKDCTQTDYSTVFYFNMIIGVVFYILLFTFAGSISRFFDEPELKWLVRVIALSIIIQSITLIQATTLTKKVDFKLLAKIGVISSAFSGAIGITMAYYGFGVWSLVVRMLVAEVISSFLLWLWNRWRPSLIFSKKSFNELFSFGSKLLISRLLSIAERNIYYVVIGKYFSAQDLGFYTRGKNFNDLLSQQMTVTIDRVTYPVLAQLQDDKIMLKSGYKKMIKSTMFVSFLLMAGLAAIAEPLVLTLIGEQWRASIIYLQLLCFVSMMYPLHSLNLNMLKVSGRSDLYLKINIVKKILTVPNIIIGVIWGIEAMILGMWATSLIAYYLNSYYSGRNINYSMREQVSDIFPSFLLALIIGAVVFIAGWYIPLGNLSKLILQIIIGGLVTISLGEIIKPESYIYIKRILVEKTSSLYYAYKAKNK